MKILITGAHGFLGSRLVTRLEKSHEVIAPTHAEMDIRDVAALRKVFDAHKPEAVVHCAALSNTWYCEQHPEESMQVNVQATRQLAELCAETGAKLIFMSSDQVYNGTPLEGPLPEDAPLAPVNHYGRHKLMAEREVRKVCPNAVGLRLTWMYDSPDSPFRLNTNVLVNLRKAYENGETVKAATHEHRGMTNVWEVVENIEKCLDVPGGIYNFGSENALDSYETFKHFAKVLGLPDGIVVADEERFADQPRNIAMDTGKMKALGINFNATT